MPEVFRQEGYVFFFYSNEGQEPIHIHVQKAGGFAKFWLDPIVLDFAQGMKTKDLARAEELVCENEERIRRRWNETHNS